MNKLRLLLLASLTIFASLIWANNRSPAVEPVMGIAIDETPQRKVSPNEAKGFDFSTPISVKKSYSYNINAAKKKYDPLFQNAKEPYHFGISTLLLVAMFLSLPFVVYFTTMNFLTHEHINQENVQNAEVIQLFDKRKAKAETVIEETKKAS